MRIGRYAFVLSLLVAAFHQVGFANPADTTLKHIINKDTRALDFYLFGDEFFSWGMTRDGYAVLVDKNGNYAYAAEDAQGVLRPSAFLAANPEQRTSREREFLATKPTYNRVSALSLGAKIARSSEALQRKASLQAPNAKSGYPTTGTNNLLVILVEYPDREFTHTQQEFQALLSQQGYNANGASGSVKDYYADCSFGQLNLNPTVVGPYMLSNPMAYYGATGETFSDVRPKEMIAEACALADSDVDFSQFDMDGDGNIDAVHVIFAGAPQSSTGETDAIWPHRWTIWESDGLQTSFDGKTLRDYSCSGEKRGSRMDGIGTICHEFGHVLGLPDFYDTDYAGSGGTALALSQWSIMASGSYNNDGDTPASFNAYEKSRLGWLDLDTLRVEGSYSLPAITDSNRAYIIPTPYDDEFFILECRRLASWDAYLPAEGMLIYHIKQTGDNCINCDPAFQRCDIEEADGIESSETLFGDVFPNPMSNSFFTDYASPNSRLWSGEELAKPLTNIHRDSLSARVFFDFLRPDSNAFLQTLASVEHLATTTKRLKGLAHYEGLYDYSFKGFEVDTLADFSTSQRFAATDFAADTFAAVVQNLDYSHTYYYRAAYLSQSGNAYGEAYSFSISDGQPMLKTSFPTNISLNSMSVEGKKLVAGDYPVLEYGICYDTLPNPRLENNHITYYGDFSSFTAEVSGLEQATKYYFVTYCRTVLGVKYASQSYGTTSFVPIENNTIAAEFSGCEGDSFGIIEGETPTAGQGNFTYLWQQKTGNSAWQDAENENTNEDYHVGVLSLPTSYRRIVYSYAIKDTSNVVTVDVKRSIGGTISAKTDWLSGETDTLRLTKHTGDILRWEHSADSVSWSVFSLSQDSEVEYTPAFSDSVNLRAVVQFEQCPEAASQTLKIYVTNDVSLSDIKPTKTYVVYPNPAKGFVRVANPLSKLLKAELIDGSGRILSSQTSNQNELCLDLTGLSAGVYTVRVTSLAERTEYVFKLVVAN